MVDADDATCSNARILTHPIVVTPAAGEYADDDEDCMVLGDFKDATHLFQSVLIKEVHDSIKALPNVGSGPVPVANSIILMTADDFEKMRRAPENTKKRMRTLDAEVVALKAETAKLRKLCHESNTQALVAETELNKRDEKYAAQVRKTRDDRNKAMRAALAAAHADHQATKATLATCQEELATVRTNHQQELSACQSALAASRAEVVHLLRENARLQSELDCALESAKRAALGEETFDLLARG